MARAWSRSEVERTVEDYFEMLAMELGGIPFSKAEHNRGLLGRLDARPRTAIEFKHANISAILAAEGYPTIDGYKPRSNYQRLLEEEVHRFLNARPALLEQLASRGDQPAPGTPAVDGEEALALVHPPPPPLPRRDSVGEGRQGFPLPEIDYLERERRNRSLGDAGEVWAMAVERARLLKADRPSLSERVERVSETEGPSAGFDIRSFEPDGRDRFVEVKTTRSGRYTPFFISRNELRFSRSHEDRYHVLRIHTFAARRGAFYLSGNVADHCRLDPESYRATLTERVPPGPPRSD